MSAIVIIAIVVAALIVLALVTVNVRRRVEQRQLLRARLASEATGHRQEADAHATRAQELGPEANALRQEATAQAASAEREATRANELGARARQAEQQISHEGQSAGRHDEKGDSSSFGGESERSREPDVLLHPPQCQPSGAEARIASRELWAAGTGPGLLPVLLSRGFVRGGRGRGIPCACRGAGWLREVVARRPWMAGGIGTDDVSQKCARLGRWPGRREPRGYQGIHGRSVQRVTPKRRGEPKRHLL